MSSMMPAGGAAVELCTPSPGEEAARLGALQADLASELATEPWAGFPELVGDVRLLRFLRGYGGKLLNLTKSH